jgi:S-(hydroxymethyl)glutathione dehydrogenase/alcohol dehydrogenase
MFEREQPFSLDGEPVFSMARVSSFSTQIVVNAFQALPVNLSPEAACLIGCAGSTGFGNVRNVARVKPGEKVLVLGLGGIGVVSLQTAQLVGGVRVFAADSNAAKAAVADEFGADGFIALPGEADVDEIASLLLNGTGGPVDAVIDFTGAATAITAAIRVLARRGRLALCGLSPRPTLASFDANTMSLMGIAVRGALNGACDPYQDMPEIVRLAESGDLHLEKVVSHRYPLDRIADAMSALRKGEVLRVVVDMV